MSIAVGQPAPDFTLPQSDGTLVSLKSLTQKGAVVLFFYPKDDTPGCTREACSFRDAYEDFKSAGAEVVGISSQDGESHRGFSERFKLTFRLLSDEGGKVRDQYGVPRSFLGLLAGRETYVIDRRGVVRHVFNSQLNPSKHVAESIAVVKRLKAEESAPA